jgi:hypothetical protein
MTAKLQVYFRPENAQVKVSLSASSIIFNVHINALYWCLLLFFCFTALAGGEFPGLNL